MTSSSYRDSHDASRHTSEPAKAEGAKPERPSAVQVVAGALTAVTATALLSLLGIWGTILGMGLLSVLTVLGNYMYSSFIQRASEKVKHAHPLATHPPGPRAARTETEKNAEPSTSFTLVEHYSEQYDDEQFGAAKPLSSGSRGTESAGAHHQAQRPAGRFRTAWRAMMTRYGLRRVLGSIAVVFAFLAGTVTVIELTAGKPISDIVRNEPGSGTSLFGTRTTGDTDTEDSTEVETPDDGTEVDEQPGGEPAPDEPDPEEEVPEEPPLQEPEQQDDAPPPAQDDSQ